MLPWSALRPFMTSFSYGDILLLFAIVLNIDRVGKLHGWQMFFLASLPLILLSLASDPDGSMVEVAQALYIFGVVLPFGWVAFAGMRPRNIVTGVLISMSLNSFVAVGQLMGFVDQIGKQSVWIVFGTTRSAGLGLSCSALCLSLTPMYPLLLYVKDYRLRLLFFSVISGGLFATLAKSIIFAVPGICYYVVKEPNRRGILILGIVTGMAISGLYVSSRPLQEKANRAATALSERVERTDGSIYERTSTLKFALGFVPDCTITGLGYAGTSRTLTQHLGNTVHVFHLGIILIGGIPAGLLHHAGVATLLLGLWRCGHRPAGVMLVAQLLGLCSMTVLMLSFQYVPFLICASILDYELRKSEQNAPRSAPVSNISRTMPQALRTNR